MQDGKKQTRNDVEARELKLEGLRCELLGEQQKLVSVMRLSQPNPVTFFRLLLSTVVRILTQNSTET
jgi:hypothetical protein